MSQEHDKISVTAKLVAYYRQFTDIPYAKDVAPWIGAKETFENIVRENNLDPSKLLEYAPLFEARYKSVVRLILNSGSHQVLELASGFSLRGLAMTPDPRMLYVETDLPGVNDEKRLFLSKIQKERAIENQGRYLVTDGNALDREQIREAAKPFRRDKPLVVVNEGLIQYLTAEERETLAGNIQTLLSEFNQGLWITPDFSLKTDSQKMSEDRRKLVRAVAGMTERRLHDSAFETPEQLDTFFEKTGFTSHVDSQLDLAPSLVSVKTLGLSESFIERLKPRLQIWTLRPVVSKRPQSGVFATRQG